MWVIFYVASFCVAGSLACGGCSTANTKETICSSTTGKFLEHDHKDVVMTNSCSLVNHGKKYYKEIVTTAMLDIKGKVGPKNISVHYDDYCKFLKRETADDRSIADQLKIYDVPNCEESEEGANEIRERQMRNPRRMSFKNLEGPYDIEVLISNINGNADDTACIRMHGDIVCDKSSEN